MNEQLTLFDMGIETDNRPCRYNFHRYVGQMVDHSRCGLCRISNIDHPYYTELKTVKDYRIIMGTPYDIKPVEEGKSNDNVV